MAFPETRMRRLRASSALRELVHETDLSPRRLLLPLFVSEALGDGLREPIVTMPGVERLSIGEAVAEAQTAAALGIHGVVLFGLPAEKDAQGSSAWDPEGVVQLAIAAIKRALPELLVVSDVCLCEYTDHGHCGVIDASGAVLNDPSLELLAATAVSHARAGADIVAPSDMMDGRVGAIRSALDAEGLIHTRIMSYAAKYASAFYGPFREAVGSGGSLKGDKKTYQMDPANSDEAMREVALDIAEGADMVMVKPGMPYLDVVRRVHDRFGVPTFAYQVSGEYAMIMAAVRNGWLDHHRAMMESLIAFKRAGAAGVLSYFSVEAAQLLHSG